LKNITHIIKGCIVKEHKYQKILYEGYYVYEGYYGYALKIVFRYVYKYEQAVDIVNDGFVKVFSHFPQFEMGSEEDNEKKLMGWLKKIMINTSIDVLRKGKMLPETGGIPEYVWDHTLKDDEADQLLLYKELIILVKGLPPAYRMVFNLYVIDGYTHNEIADLLNIPTGTSKSSLSRARELLQQCLKKIEDAQVCKI
jgi:RNA polymerase sigma factor (sigma-70 family)